eukprot:CAMPEP_0201959884 /NCGR_PEP_ID=MMETSP0904-20121228/6713_1 /ASSEMBLY_ACC=CAM_ASM_000553 /TAXON_ID=420261 /ORGANISM="Thalassiosira antarctica, Strain CCMP982" /LENGTH=85 /DNA_ID=CAMNT_0048505649 /DNA_START=420 /DNA_END=677 /DNA_ORIENTATION=-
MTPDQHHPKIPQQWSYWYHYSIVYQCSYPIRYLGRSALFVFVPHAYILGDGGAFTSDVKIPAVLLLSLASPSSLNIRASSSAMEW